jgi:hypothetical protein
MKVKEAWVAEPTIKEPTLVEEWRVMRFIKDKPALTVQPNGWGYSNAKLEKSFYYLDVYYKFIENGIKFSYDEKRGYKPLMKYIKFPSEYISTHKNVYILEKVGSLKYKFIKVNRLAKIKIIKTT